MVKNLATNLTEILAHDMPRTKKKTSNGVVEETKRIATVFCFVSVRMFVILIKLYVVFLRPSRLPPTPQNIKKITAQSIFIDWFTCNFGCFEELQGGLKPF